MSNGALAKKLVAVTAALDWQEKRGTNAAQGYKYVQAVDIFDAVRTELTKQNVLFGMSQDDITVHYPESGGQHIVVKGSYTFTDAETGEVELGHWTGFDIDKSGKALWKALTGATKYIFITRFMLPMGQDPEATDEDGKSTAPAQPKAEAKTTGPTPPKAEQVKTEKAGLTPKQRGLFESEMHRRGLESAGQRKAFITFATGRLSSKQMTSDDLDKALAELKDDASVAVSNALAVV